MLLTPQQCDVRGTQYTFKDHGELYVCQPYNTPFWKFGPAKVGDVGMDLPVRIKNMGHEKINPAILGINHDTCPTCCQELDPEKFIDYKQGVITIPPKMYASLPSGIHVKIPDDAWGSIRPRSSTGWKMRVQVFEGTIDSGYTGQLACLIYNPNDDPVTIRDGERLAQFVVIPKYDLQKIVFVDTLPETARGETGFGSTG